MDKIIEKVKELGLDYYFTTGWSNRYILLVGKKIETSKIENTITHKGEIRILLQKTKFIVIFENDQHDEILDFKSVCNLISEMAK